MEHNYVTKKMCEAVEKLVKEENARVEERAMISAVQHAAKAFNVSEEEAATSLGYSAESYEKAKKHQNMMV